MGAVHSGVRASEAGDWANRYLRATNSRRWAINHLLDIAESFGARRLVDVGAGDGELAAALADRLDFVAAIEPDLLREPALRGVAECRFNLECIPTRVEHVDLPEASFDMGLLSYVLETLSDPDQDSVLTSSLRLLGPSATLVGISFVEGSEWDQYVEICKNVCGGSRYVGFGELAKALRTRGWLVRKVKEFPTRIAAADLADLFEVCAHFMDRRAPLYLAERERLEPELSKLSSRSQSGVVLDVRECLYTVSPPALGPR